MIAATISPPPIRNRGFIRIEINLYRSLGTLARKGRRSGIQRPFQRGSPAVLTRSALQAQREIMAIEPAPCSFITFNLFSDLPTFAIWIGALRYPLTHSPKSGPESWL